MIELKTKMTGFDELNKKLIALPQRVENNILQKSVTGALRTIVPAVKAAAPRDEKGQSPSSKKYGRLRRNIRVIRLKRIKAGRRAARINTGNSFWGMLLEFGTKYITAKPWFAPKIRQLAPRVFDALGKTLGAGIEKEAMRK